MMTAEFMLSKRPVLRFTAALFFLLKYSLLFNCDRNTGNFDGTKQLTYSLEPTARAKYFYP